MFDNLRANLRKRRRRKSMRPRHGSARRRSKRWTLKLTPPVKIGALAVLALGIIAVVVFVFIKPFGDGKNKKDEVVEVTATPTPTTAPLASADMSEDASELVMQYKSINDPYMNGSEVVFTTDPESSAMLSKVGIYDIETGQTTLVDKIEKKNFSLFEPKINDDFIVYLDCKSEYGGAVCCYDRAKEEVFVMREYMYGKPQVALVGNYALWMQQTGPNTDKLYMFDLTNREHTVIEVFVPMVYVSAADMCEDAIVFVQPYRQTEVDGYGTSSLTENEMCIIPMNEGGDNERVVYYPGMFIYEPKISGDYIVFLNGTGDEKSRLMMCHKEGDTYSEPEEIDVGVLNYDVGDGYVAYTLDDVVYIYYFEDGSSGRLSAETTRARLASANGKGVIWYDVTGGLDTESDVIMSITVP